MILFYPRGVILQFGTIGKSDLHYMTRQLVVGY